ncbi:MAG: c-type cytochrome [Gemmatimonadales bacterium]
MSMRLVLMGLLTAVACSSGGEDESRAQVLATTRGDPGRGETAIAKHGCGSCHVIPGIQRARGKVGPPLTDFAQRSYIAGHSTNTPANLAAWIRRPDSVEPGTVMPALGVSEQEARDISAYLYLETVTDQLGPPHPLPASLLRVE